MFQAWQTVQVTNEQSGYFGQAGTVVRVETQGANSLVTVKLDLVDEPQQFANTELRMLGA